MKIIQVAIVFFLIGACEANSQYQMYRFYNDSWINVNSPVIVNIDTIINNYTFNTATKGILQCISDIGITTTYSDSSRFHAYGIESGKVIESKKFGKWIRINGVVENDIRKKGTSSHDYYFNDYLIPDVEHFSDSISYDLEDKKATCYFKYINPRTDTIQTQMRVDYWTNFDADSTFVKCSTLDKKEIFRTTTEYVEEEFNLLYTNYYYRKIYGR
jgi:hypothetical protein